MQWIRSEKGLILKTSALESLYSGQIYCLINSIDRTKQYFPLSTDAAPQFILKKLTPYRHASLTYYLFSSNLSILTCSCYM